MTRDSHGMNKEILHSHHRKLTFFVLILSQGALIGTQKNRKENFKRTIDGLSFLVQKTTPTSPSYHIFMSLERTQTLDCRVLLHHEIKTIKANRRLQALLPALAFKP